MEMLDVCTKACAESSSTEEDKGRACMVDRKRWRAMSALSEAGFRGVPGCRHALLVKTCKDMIIQYRVSNGVS